MKLLRDLWSKLTRAEVTPEPAAHGVLFGIDPPAGCHFRVSNHYDGSWHVRIMQREKELAHECELIGWAGGKRSDEALIVAAAKKALASYGDRDARAERARVVRELEGCYPPKQTSRA